MANRSDFNSASLPRSIKRMLAAVEFKDAHEYGEEVRAWVEVHKHHKAVRNRSLKARDTSKNEAE